MLRQHYHQDHVELRRCHAEGCDFVAGSVKDLELHSSNTRLWHPSFQCPIQDYSRTYTTLPYLLGHQKQSHEEGRPELRNCHECGQSARSQSGLQKHAFDTEHASFACSIEECSSTFSRVDVLERHGITHFATTIRYPLQVTARNTVDRMASSEKVILHSTFAAIITCDISDPAD